MVPIYLPQADKPSDAIVEAEAMLLERDGLYHVGQLYFAKPADASFVRRIEAERIVREQERHEALVCAFCFEKFGGQVAVVIAMRPVHPACAKEFDAWVSDHPSENDPRWLKITDDSPVEFDGEMCSWGSLAGNEKITVEIQADGRLVGGFPL